MSSAISQQQIYSWVNNILQNENIENYTLNNTKSSLEGEGYSSDIIFIKINGKKKLTLENVELDIILKINKIAESLSNKNIQEAYRREVLVYDKIFPAFKKFETERRVKDIFSSVPKCYQTLSIDERVILCLENLRTQGYVEHNRLEPMNISHIKLVLKNYAKFHAISFAFKDQNRTEFEKLLENYSDLFYKIMLETPFSEMIQPKAISTYNLIKNVDEKLATKIKTLIEKGLLNGMKEIFKDVPQDSVIRHGDCWNSNFLFKYINGDKEYPTNVAILDWQLSSYHSPALDVAYFLFAVSSTEQVAHFDEFLIYYHEQLSHYISELGSNPEELFPFSSLLEHWKKYSVFGVIVVWSFLGVVLCNKEDAIKLDNFDNEEDLVEAMLEVKPKNNELLIDRILATSGYYFQLVEK